MLGLFKKNAKNTVSVLSPLTGNSVPLEKVPDEAFSAKFMGDGVAIEPSEGVLVAPFDGTIAHLIDTHHAVILEHASGAQLLLHIGINTVGLKGEGFSAKVDTGDTVKAGQTLIEFDIDRIKAAGLPTITPIVVANQEVVEKLENTFGQVTRGQGTVISLTMK